MFTIYFYHPQISNKFRTDILIGLKTMVEQIFGNMNQYEKHDSQTIANVGECDNTINSMKRE